MSDLGDVELTIYFVGWVGAVLYSMYHFHLICSDFSYLLSEDLEPGWSWVGRKVDVADNEWNTWTPILLEWLKFVAFYLVVNQFLRRKFPQLATGFSLLISFAWLWSSLGLPLSLFLLLQPIIFIWIFKFFSMTAVWVVCLSLTYALHSSLLTHLKDVIFEEKVLFAVLLTWTHARSISFIADTKSCTKKDDDWSFIKCYRYCFYLPLLPSGPLLLYQSFKESVEKTPSTLKWSTFIHGIAQVMRYSFWWFFHQLALHFFYHSAVHYNKKFVRHLDVWSAAGFGYSLGQFFMLKYTVLYGLPSALASLDQVDSPPPPKCIGRIHLYSQMWRDFDKGLYNFMLKYIYIPFKKSYDSTLASLIGSALCFSFVCIWHGASKSVVVWCVANYLGLCIEMAAKFCSTLQPIASWKLNWSTANWLRFQAIFAAPLLLMSALANFCFFTDANVGYILAYKALIEGGVFRLCCILFVMYCCCQVSMAFSRWSVKKKAGQHSQ